MLGKLLKYDLKWCYKPLGVFYLLGFFFSIMVRIIEGFESNLMVLIIDKICCGIVISMIASIMINCFMRNWARVIKNIYKDEAYLTHTLPVSKDKIYLSKVLAMVITLLTSFVVILICLAVATLNKDTLIVLKDGLENMAIYFDSSILWLVLVMGSTIFLEFLFMLLSGMLGIIIGYRSNNFKLIKSIVIGFGVYVILSIMSVGILYVVGLFDLSIMDVFNNVLVSSSTLKKMMLIGILMYAIYNIGIYFVGNKLFNRGVNLE